MLHSNNLQFSPDFQSHDTSGLPEQTPWPPPQQLGFKNTFWFLSASEPSHTPKFHLSPNWKHCNDGDLDTVPCYTLDFCCRTGLDCGVFLHTLLPVWKENSETNDLIHTCLTKGWRYVALSQTSETVACHTLVTFKLQNNFNRYNLYQTILNI